MNYNVAPTFRGKPYRKMHPWLMVCFAIGWGLLTILVVLQDHAIDAQRELIQLLLQDLHQGLTTSVAHRTGASLPVVLKQVGSAASATTNSRASSVPVPSTQLPSQQVQSQSTPSVQVPLQKVPAVPSSKVPSQAKGSSRTPSSQEKNAAGANQGRTSRKAARPLPVRPPAEITDPSDMRRVKFST
jgi:hypothetical protein